ncbi:hypothetical protein BH09BAC2_BH09BAC2_13530 [soil metagenome]
MQLTGAVQKTKLFMLYFFLLGSGLTSHSEYAFNMVRETRTMELGTVSIWEGTISLRVGKVSIMVGTVSFSLVRVSRTTRKEVV